MKIDNERSMTNIPFKLEFIKLKFIEFIFLLNFQSPRDDFNFLNFQTAAIVTPKLIHSNSTVFFFSYFPAFRDRRGVQQIPPKKPFGSALIAWMIRDISSSFQIKIEFSTNFFLALHDRCWGNDHLFRPGKVTKENIYKKDKIFIGCLLVCDVSALTPARLCTSPTPQTVCVCYVAVFHAAPRSP